MLDNSSSQEVVDFEHFPGHDKEKNVILLMGRIVRRLKTLLFSPK